MLSLLLCFLYVPPLYSDTNWLLILSIEQIFSGYISVLLLALAGGCRPWALARRPAYMCRPATAGGAPPSSADPETSRGPSSDLCRAESGHSRAGHKANGGRPQDAGRVGEQSDTRLRGADATDAVAA